MVSAPAHPEVFAPILPFFSPLLLLHDQSPSSSSSSSSTFPLFYPPPAVFGLFCCFSHLLYSYEIFGFYPDNRRVKRGLFPSSESFKSALLPRGRSETAERVIIIYSAPRMNSLLYAYSNGMFTSCSSLTRLLLSRSPSFSLYSFPDNTF